MPGERFELSKSFDRRVLSTVRFPVSPPGHGWTFSGGGGTRTHRAVTPYLISNHRLLTVRITSKQFRSATASRPGPGAAIRYNYTNSQPRDSSPGVDRQTGPSNAFGLRSIKNAAWRYPVSDSRLYRVTSGNSHVENVIRIPYRSEHGWMETIGYVFGYGSLADPTDHLYQERNITPIYGILDGFERHWRVAFDNMEPNRDNKHYLVDGERYEGYISMLGATPESGSRCNGVAIPVDAELADLFETREGNLYRLSEDLRDLFSVKLDLPLRTYIPLDSGMDLYDREISKRNVALPSSYVDLVETAFRARGEEAHSIYLESTEHPAGEILAMEFYRKPGTV